MNLGGSWLSLLYTVSFIQRGTRCLLHLIRTGHRASYRRLSRYQFLKCPYFLLVSQPSSNISYCGYIPPMSIITSYSKFETRDAGRQTLSPEHKESHSLITGKDIHDWAFNPIIVITFTSPLYQTASTPINIFDCFFVYSPCKEQPDLYLVNGSVRCLSASSEPRLAGGQDGKN